mgnify:CR=1 FL=1
MSWRGQATSPTAIIATTRTDLSQSGAGRAGFWRRPAGPGCWRELKPREGLSQSRGFRTLIETKNFPSATILLRTQIDTAMRINGLTMMVDIEACVQRLFKGERTFDRLMSGTPVGGGRQERLADAFLKRKLAEDHPWIEPLYAQTSDFVHLSFRHLFTAIADTNSETRMATLAIIGIDPKRDGAVYYEVCDAFFRVSRLTSTTILAMLMMRHRRDRVIAAAATRAGGGE